jgi:hypothetical protein
MSGSPLVSGLLIFRITQRWESILGRYDNVFAIFPDLFQVKANVSATTDTDLSMPRK